jgi:DNA-binding response OmpR family regulator/REP element-mobilizing transposase RayT
MRWPALVVSPDEGFGELISLTLEEMEDLEAQLVKSGSEALAAAGETPYVLSILDADIGDMSLVELARGLMALRPELKVILIPPENDPSAADLAELNPVGYLSKPFYLPDLETLVNAALRDVRQLRGDHLPDAAGERAEGEPPPWLLDVSLAVQHLTRLSLESAAQAALITRGSELWAYAGQLPQPATEELAQAVVDIWAEDEGVDLARFIRLETTNKEYLLYATGLMGNLVLALAFDIHTPFSEIRGQASRLARALSSPPMESEETAPSPEEPEAKADEAEEAVEEPQADVLPAIPLDWRPDEGLSEERPDFLDSLLVSADPTLTERETPQEIEHLGHIEEIPPRMAEGWEFDLLQDETVDLEQHAELVEALEAVTEKEEPTVKEGDQVPAEEETPVEEPATQLEAGPPVPEEEPVFEEEAVPAGTIDEIFPQEEEPQPAPVSIGMRGMKPVTAGLYELYYTCVLVPRIPNQHLVGDVAGLVAEWVRKLCIAFGWRLMRLTIRPDYLLCMADVPPGTAPGRFIKILRRYTSSVIAAEFPSVMKENPSGDFWAPGYLVTGGRDLPAPELIQEFHQRTRLRQGLSG